MGLYDYKNDGTMALHKSDMLQYVAVLIVFHTTGLSLEKSIDVLKQHGAVVLSAQRVHWMASHLIAF